MKSILRTCLSCLAFIASWSQAAAPDPSLVGCWRAAKIVLFLHDGSKVEDASGRCVLQFKEEQFESACGTSGGTATTTYEYRVVRPNFYAATMRGSTFRTDLIGSTREYEYHVEGDRLLTVTKPPVPTPAPPTAAVRVETEATKTPCP